MKLIVSNFEKRKVFDLFNILLVNGYSPKDILLVSKHKSFFLKVLKYFCYHNVEHISVETLNWLDVFRQIESTYTNEVLILLPTEEDVVIAYYNYVEEFPGSRLLCELPDKQVFNIVRDKLELSNFCKSNAIPTPIEFKSVEHSKMPFICKPKIGNGARGIYIVKTREDLLSLPDSLQDNIFQEYLDNSTGVIGAFAFAKNGKIISMHLHRRMLTYPRAGGVSVKSVTIYDQKLVEDYFKPLLLKLNYSGMIMAEYLYDSVTFEYKLLEINPRVWGSILLSEISESKIINNYINSLLMGELIETVGKKDRYLWWVVPYGVFSFFKETFFWRRENLKFVAVNMSYTSIVKSFFFHVLVYLKMSKIVELFKWQR